MSKGRSSRNPKGRKPQAGSPGRPGPKPSDRSGSGPRAGKPSDRSGSGPRAGKDTRSGGEGSARRREGRRPPSRSGQRSRAAKRGLGGDHVEGRHAVRELLLAGTRRVREVLLIEDLERADILEDITELALETKVPLRPLSRRRFEAEALTESHQGVLARAAELPEHSLDELAKKRRAHLLVLDGVTDPQNLGAILRTAECAGVTGVVLPKHRAVHISPTVAKTAAGAIEHIPMAVVGGIPTAVAQLNEMGVLTVGLDMAGDNTIFELALDSTQPVALVLGAEGVGLGRLVSQRVGVVSSIPMFGQLNSLNVATAAAIAMFEVVRRRQAN